MLAHFKLSDFLLNKLNAVVSAHWPEAKPAKSETTHFKTNEMATVLYWHLQRSPTANGSCKHTSLQVKMSPVTLTLNDGSHFNLKCDSIVLEHVESTTTQLITVGGPTSVHSLPIGMADIELAHEFEKRLTELKATMAIAKAA